ncbi:hypothetical protein MNBD_GAMMA22-976 [hydrothermal vent metagenome]|uniref:Uncharacterized protein n=1 Tax=hydrothermal vent metagenome TaxID=652676 RepID=A0A3B1A5C4_9ZZZZ
MHLSIATSAYAEERRLLLITKPDYKPSPLDKNELRRLFLGIPVYRKGERLIPLVNKSGDLCYQVFLQSILGMSQKRYERVLVSGFYRQGVRSPTVYTSQDNLLLDLKNKKLGISFLFDNDSGEEKNFNVVQEIWVSDTP